MAAKFDLWSSVGSYLLAHPHDTLSHLFRVSRAAAGGQALILSKDPLDYWGNHDPPDFMGASLPPAGWTFFGPSFEYPDPGPRRDARNSGRDGCWRNLRAPVGRIPPDEVC